MNTTTILRRTAAFAALIALALALSSCGKNITSQETLPTLVPASMDPAAGSWKMILLSGPTQISVPAPAPTASAGYQAELAQIKAAQAAITDGQRTALEYWSAGGVLRWNQILRELVAAADLPPAPNPDGSYPSPNPANPFADPRYPFSNPPYAARAYAYVSVAQYEALKVAWYYKFQYNRLSPSQVDPGVQMALPTTTLPSYPSEDAVVSTVNQVLLLALFPTSADEINTKAAEQQQVALLSGRASPSDIAGGIALGKAVAAAFLARAGTDGMKLAGGNAAEWQALVTDTAARGEIPWKSQDGPPRPPMLPLFSNVKGWMVTPANIVTERPLPPPSTASAQMTTELAEVQSASNGATADQVATVYKWADGVSTPTPSGHWNAIAEPYVAAANFSEVRAARVFALVNMAMMDGAIACWDTKYFYFNPRPTQLAPGFKALIAMPNFPSYESGHSVFSAAGSSVLSYLFPSSAANFDALAQEAALSRLYGGIHYRSDIAAGLDHGKRIAAYTIRFAQADGASTQ